MKYKYKLKAILIAVLTVATSPSFSQSPSASAQRIPEAAVTQHQDAIVIGADQATYVNTSSGLSATNMQAALDEVVTMVEDGETTSSSDGLFASLESSNDSDNMVIPQIATVASMTAREKAVFGSNTLAYPIMSINESDSPNFHNSVAGYEGWRKYDAIWVRGSTRLRFAAAQALYPDLLACQYATTHDPQHYNSPYHTGSSGPSYTHEFLIDKLAYTTDFGDPRLEDANDTTHQIYPGHYMSTVLKTTVNAPGVVPATGTVSFTLSNVTGFQDDNAVIIYDGESPTATVADEVAAGTSGFTNAAIYRIDSVNTTTNTITVERNRYGDGNTVGSIRADGSFPSHPVGSKVMIVPEGQGSVKHHNLMLNTHPDGFRDTDGNTLIEAYLRHMNRFIGLDANGDPADIVFDCDAEDVNEVTFHFNTYQGDFNGDNVEDDLIVNNVNKRREMSELGSVKKVESGGILNVIGKPTGPGGTKEPALNNFNFYQVEHISTSQQKTDDEDQDFSDLVTEFHRAKLLHKSSTHPWYGCIVSKHYSTAFPFGGSPTSNNALHTKFSVAWMTGNSFCNLNNDSNNAWIDAWLGMGAVDSAGNAIANANDNQADVKSNKRWIGKLVGDTKNISGVNLDALTPVFERKYNTTTDVSDWTRGGGSASGTVSHDADNGRLVFDGYNSRFNYNDTHIRTPEIIASGGTDVGKFAVIRLEIGSNATGIVQWQIGNSVSQNQEIYITKGARTKITVVKELSAADDDSGVRRSFRFEPSRLNDPQVSNAALYVYGVEIYVDNSIDNRVWRQEAENAYGICNGKSTSHTVNFAAGQSLTAVDLSAFTPNQQADYVSNGEVFNTANPLVMPSETCITLRK